ncbi:fibronectin type III domain-containing protein [Pseudoxanthomonas mexicana]|uniref:fibronectin type III domain-containing protein n=1 Tax=Pseudoxanthomonas mexicana TaxID=128785 RepID=UPI0028B183CD|nr:fibronectin type III domain-containing protein [Pseudoxanthomonas mexicana]
MAKTTYIQTNFTAGELTPRMKGRPDVARYQNGAETIENGIVSVHGGVERRDGLRYIAEAKHAGARVVDIVRYVFNVDQAYLLEFGHLYVRFYTSDGAQLLDESLQPLEIASPYTEDQLFQITRKQGGDTMFMWHPDVPTQRLRRLTGAQWVLEPVPWIAEPFAEIGHSPDARLTLSAATVGTGRTFTTTPTTAPGAPTIGTATPLKAAASVSFTPPANNGGIAITHYTVTSSPGGITASGPSSPVYIPGLTNGVAYTFTVTATNSVGTSSASAASNSATPLSSLPDASTTVVITPTAFVAEVGNSTQSIDGPTASASGGVGPYSYAWTVIGGAGITVIRSNTAQVRLQSTGFNATNYATLRCTVTDSGGRVGTRDCNVSITHRLAVTPPDGGGPIP